MSADDDDIIDITNTTQYVQVNNAHTSPMTTFYDYDFSTNESKHHFQHYSPDYNQSEFSKYNGTKTTSSELINLFPFYLSSLTFFCIKITCLSDKKWISIEHCQNTVRK